MKVSNPNIIFAGYMDNATMITHYKKAEVFISLSLDEGFGIPVLEAAYFNCKLLLSDIEVYQELYGEMATFINPTDVMAVSNAISQLVQNHSTNNTANAPLLAAHTYKNSAAELLSLSDAFF
jgi:glycosyltransferase involved in cell wall biosynthesis